MDECKCNLNDNKRTIFRNDKVIVFISACDVPVAMFLDGHEAVTDADRHELFKYIAIYGTGYCYKKNLATPKDTLVVTDDYHLFKAEKSED